MKCGLPYKGSKNKLAEKIVGLLPKAENFYDLFCGAEFKHNSKLSASANNEVFEKIFVPKTSEKIIYHNKSIFEL